MSRRKSEQKTLGCAAGLQSHPKMPESVELKDGAKTHLKGLSSEIKDLIGHAMPKGKGLPMKCWTTNSQDVDVALTVLQAAGSSINDAVTRFNLVFKANPGEAASESMAQEMAGFCQQMVSSLMLLPSVGASDAMVLFFALSARAVLHSLKDVVDALLDTSKHAEINGLTGVVWEACKELHRAPKTNKLACRRQMMQWSVAIKDTIDEFQGAARDAKAAGETMDASPSADATGDVSGSAEGSSRLEKTMGELSLDGQDFQDDFDFGEEDMAYSASELRCVDAALDLLRALRRCLKTANDSLHTLDSAATPATDKTTDVNTEESKREMHPNRNLAWAQALQGCLAKANDCAGEFGILLYPALNRSELTARAEDLRRALLEFCDKFDELEPAPNAPSSGSCDGKRPPPLREVVVETAEVLLVELAKL